MNEKPNLKPKLHPKLKKNIYDLRHDRYLSRSHTIVSIFFGLWLAFLGTVATYIIEGKHPITKNIEWFVVMGTASICVVGYLFYFRSKQERFNTIEKIMDLNSEAERL